MKTKIQNWNAAARLAGLIALALLLTAAAVPRAAALLREPDNVVFGTISIRGRQITAQDFAITVEARRATNGPAIASYQMGGLAAAGDFYSLRIPLESLQPASPGFSAGGETLFIVVTDGQGDLDRKQIQVGARGRFLRLDFGSALPDSDNDSLPDAWELAMFGNLGQGRDGDPDGDGIGNMDEYLAGTNPKDRADGLKLSIRVQSAAQGLLTVRMKPAQGTGYAGLERRYSLEYSTNLSVLNWFGVAGATNVPGVNAELNHQAALEQPYRWYRARAWLQPAP